MTKRTMMKLKQLTAIALSGVAISAPMSGCKPAGPPPDLLNTQREALDKAKAVDGQLQQQADEHKKAIDDAQK
jgi:hypothetical protein